MQTVFVLFAWSYSVSRKDRKREFIFLTTINTITAQQLTLTGGWPYIHQMLATHCHNQYSTIT